MTLPENTVELAAPHQWQEAESFSGKVEPLGGSLPLRIRLEPDGSCVRLRGAIKVKAGQTVNGGDSLFKIPAGLRPVANSYFLVAGESVQQILVAADSTGVAWEGTELKAGENVFLDGITWSIT